MEDAPIGRVDAMRKLVLPLLISFLVCATARAQESGAWADKLFGGQNTHDFGTVARGSQLKHTFKMTNIWKVPLELTDVKISCGCLKAEPSTKQLQPGETGTFTIFMDAKQFSGPKIIHVKVTVGPKYISTASLTKIGRAHV